MEPELLDAEDEEGPGASRRGLVLVPSNAALRGGDGWVIRADDLAGLRRTLADERARHDRERSPLAAAVDAAQRAAASAEDRLRAAMAAAAAAGEDLGALRERAAAWAVAEADLAAAKQVRADAEAALLAAQADVTDFEAARGAVEWALRDTRAGLERHRAVGGGGGLDGSDGLGGLGDAGLMAEIARVEEVARRVAAERAEAQVTLDALRHGRAEAAKADQELAELVETHRARLAFLAVDEPVALSQAVAAYQQAAEGAPIDAGALSIAEQWAELDRRSAELAAGEPPPPTAAELQRARRRVDEANRMLADEMEAARLASLSDETRAQIEAAQEEVLAAEEAVNGHRGVGQVTAAKARLTEILEGAGFASYLDYLVSGHTIDPRQDRKVAAAQNIVRRAEAQLHELEVRGTPSSERLRLEEERRTLVRLAVDVLGFSPVARVEEVLRAQLAVDPETTSLLREALAAVGVRPTDRPLITTATAWLAGWQEARERRAGIEAELGAAERRLAAAQAAGAGTTRDALIGAAEAAVERATQRERHANRLAATLVEAMEVEGRTDTIDPDLAARVDALVALRERLEGRFKAALDAASTALAAAVTGQAAADAALERAEDALDPILGEDWDEAAVGARMAALTEEAEAAGVEASAAAGASEEAGAGLDGARRELAAYDADPPPAVGNLQSVVVGIGWLARRRPVASVVLLDPFDVGPAEVEGLLDALTRLARDVQVVYATDAPEVLRAVTGGAAAVGGVGAEAPEADAAGAVRAGLAGGEPAGNVPGGRSQRSGKRRSRR